MSRRRFLHVSAGLSAYLSARLAQSLAALTAQAKCQQRQILRTYTVLSGLPGVFMGHWPAVVCALTTAGRYLHNRHTMTSTNLQRCWSSLKPMGFRNCQNTCSWRWIMCIAYAENVPSTKKRHPMDLAFSPLPHHRSTQLKSVGWKRFVPAHLTDPVCVRTPVVWEQSALTILCRFKVVV